MYKAPRTEILFEGYFQVVLTADDVVTVLAASATGMGHIKCMEIPIGAFPPEEYPVEPGTTGVVHQLSKRSTGQVYFGVTVASWPEAG